MFKGGNKRRGTSQKRNSEEVENVITFEIESITAELPKVDLGPIITFSGGIKHIDIKHLSGHINLLLGIHEARLFPNQLLQSLDNLLLYPSIFGSGLLLTGHHPLIKPGVVLQSHQAMHAKSRHHVFTKPATVFRLTEEIAIKPGRPWRVYIVEQHHIQAPLTHTRPHYLPRGWCHKRRPDPNLTQPPWQPNLLSCPQVSTPT